MLSDFASSGQRQNIPIFLHVFDVFSSPLVVGLFLSMGVGLYSIQYFFPKAEILLQKVQFPIQTHEKFTQSKFDIFFLHKSFSVFLQRKSQAK